MTAWPWYLLAAGIILVIVGLLLGALMNPPGSGRAIHSRMTDDEISRKLENEQRLTLSSLVVLLGLVCVMASIIWRISLWIYALTQRGP